MAETENFLRTNIIDTVTYTHSLDMPTNIQVIDFVNYGQKLSIRT